MRERLIVVARVWIPLAIAISIGCLGLNALDQHIFRSLADDPQVQLAQDGAAALDSGGSPESIVPSTTVDPGASIAPFIMVYDAEGAVLAGNARIAGSAPAPPIGVLQTAVKVHGNRVTWQPTDEIRIATVVYPTEDGRTVLAGRSLRETESRIRSAEQIVGLGWLFTLTVTFFAAWFAQRIGRRTLP